MIWEPVELVLYVDVPEKVNMLKFYENTSLIKMSCLLVIGAKTLFRCCLQAPRTFLAYNIQPSPYAMTFPMIDGPL